MPQQANGRPSADRERQQVPLEVEGLAAMLGAGGQVSRALPDYEDRPEQVQMLRAVAEAFNRGQVLVVEAGTGVGKSLAYGLPAAAFAQATGQRVVISTATINLQEQLTHKDLPLVAEALRRPLKVVLVKGRGNYLCRRRLQEKTRQQVLVEADGREDALEELAWWAESTADGSRSDLPFAVREELWEEICSDADTCLGHRCPCRSDCFFWSARRLAEHAEILVVNHHLLFADLAVRRVREDWAGRAVLPPFGHVILDEAHDLEDAASGFFGTRLSRAGVLRQLSRLHAPRRKGGSSLLLEVAAEVANLGGALALGRSERLLEEGAGSVDSLVHVARKSFEDAYGLLSRFALKLAGEAGAGDARVRLTPGVFADPDWPAIQEGFRQAATSVQALAGRVQQLVERLADLTEENSKATEARACALRLKALGADAALLVDERLDGLVRWMEVDRHTRKRVHLVAAPLDVAGMMNESLLATMSTVVLTSATMSVGGSFDFFRRRVGVDLQSKQRVRDLLAQSPFDFATQARLAIPEDLPAPPDPLFEQRLPEAVFQAVAVSGGRALVLFTSWGLMTRVFTMVRERLEALGIEVLCQGEAPRDRLLMRFREEETSVLFGTDSFWQGVDVIGPALRNVVITRLPFDVPDEPLIQARLEALERTGASSFQELMLPRAVLKLKQGFGRLIRSRNDWGMVVVMDRRIVSRPYGKKFLDSLPPVTLLTGALPEVCSSLAIFFSERGGEAPARVVPLG